MIYLHNQYCYQELTDELWVKVSTGKRLFCGPLKKLKRFGLPELIRKYKEAIDVYTKANEKVQRMFESRNAGTSYDEYLYDDLYSSAIPNRNDKANFVSRLYFCIAQYPRQKLTLEYLAIRAVIKNKLNYHSLPNSLKTKIEVYL